MINSNHSKRSKKNQVQVDIEKMGQTKVEDLFQNSVVDRFKILEDGVNKQEGAFRQTQSKPDHPVIQITKTKLSFALA